MPKRLHSYLYAIQKFLKEDTMPDVWKRAFITSVHKKDLITDVTNYHPLSECVSRVQVYGESNVYLSLQHFFHLHNMASSSADPQNTL